MCHQSSTLGGHLGMLGPPSQSLEACPAEGLGSSTRDRVDSSGWGGRQALRGWGAMLRSEVQGPGEAPTGCLGEPVGAEEIAGPGGSAQRPGPARGGDGVGRPVLWGPPRRGGWQDWGLGALLGRVRWGQGQTEQGRAAGTQLGRGRWGRSGRSAGFEPERTGTRPSAHVPTGAVPGLATPPWRPVLLTWQ